MVRLCVSKRYRAKPVIAFGGGCPVRSSVCRPSPQSYEAAIGVIGVNSLIALCDDDAAASRTAGISARHAISPSASARAMSDGQIEALGPRIDRRSIIFPAISMGQP